MRVESWHSKFFQYLEEARTRQFQWGTFDCVLLAAGAVDAILGTDYVVQARSRHPYTSEEEARTIMAANGGLTGLISSFVGEPVNWGQLSTGDIALVAPLPHCTDMEMLCIHDGSEYLIAPGKPSLIKVHLRHAIHGWRIN